MPYLDSPPASPGPVKNVRRLVLCFDGTGNDFQGNTADTNVVKIYDKLDRNDDNQYHYYQPGIGTYDISGGSVNKDMIGNFRSKVSRAIDSAIATSFDAHVMAGYKFLMNYHEPEGKIYMFGFSRGAFTARFLSRMINTVGLLSRGNDEMIPFAYSLYQEYEQAKSGESEEERDNKRLKLQNFTSTFCRQDRIYHPGEAEACYGPIKVYFLGIFDCVRSVAVLESPFGKTPKPVSVVGTAEHVRHAVAVDEFRVKFKAALLHQDRIQEEGGKDESEDVKEVWFPGNHGDVGGGWPAHKLEKKKAQHSWWQKLAARGKAFFHSDKKKTATNVLQSAYQMSDIPLSWMIRELELLGIKEEAYALQWSERLDGFKRHFNQDEARKASRHNTLTFGRGSGWLKVLMWKFMEYVPLFPRYELQDGQWILQTLPPNKESARDIPTSALLHASLLHRINDTTRARPYLPRNNHGSNEKPCLVAKDFIKLDIEDATDDFEVDSAFPKVDHTIYALNQETITAYKRDVVNIAKSKEHTHAYASSVTTSSAVNGVNNLKARPVVRVQEISN